ncbi:MAG: acyl-CoA dehydrogenase family protein, partial [Burkholderiales bacterium]
MSYVAPVKDMLFVIDELAGLAEVNALPGCEDATLDTVEAVLGESAKFCSEVVAPLNFIGDKEPSYWHDGQVSTTKGFKEAFKAFGEAGWQGVQHPVEFGGQGLPKLVASACSEMINAANVSFALCPMLTDGAIEALMTAGSDSQKNIYLANLISGKWTGTMNLTEPQAGSDLAAVRSRAVPQADGTYKVFGTKIFITFGEHDMAENIIHLVLARTPDAPEGVKGISLFLVPKFLINSDGSLGARNDAYCVSIEHKLGIKASPTAVLQFGDHGGATGMLVGEENRGLEYMFIMMNAARFGVGLQGVGLAERAYQKASHYAKERVQSRNLTGSPGPVTIIHHPDVRRMLMSMRSQTEAARALSYVTA